MLMLIISALITGLGLGSMYGLLALGYYVTYSVSETVNFAQGSSMMLGAVVCYSFGVTFGWNMPSSIVIALIACACWGVMVERFAVRPFAKGGSNMWLMSTVAAGIVLENVALFTFGKEPRMLPSILPTHPIPIAEIGVLPLQILIPVVGLLLGVALHLVSRWTKQGKAMLAVVQNPDASRLLGINVQAAIVTAYIVSTVFAGVAGILIAPLFNVSSDMGTMFGIKAFAVAILGGITSAWGVMVAGILYGVAESLITALFGSPYTHILTFSVVIVALAIMPNGLFGRAKVKKV
jgi:branched-chain amino acid transport system permease protein